MDGKTYVLWDTTLMLAVLCCGVVLTFPPGRKQDLALARLVETGRSGAIVLAGIEQILAGLAASGDIVEMVNRRAAILKHCLKLDALPVSYHEE